MGEAYRGGCSPGLNKCKISCLHRQRIEDYRIERHHQEVEEDRETLGYETERKLRRDEGLRPITFKDWLIGHREKSGDEGGPREERSRVNADDLEAALKAAGW